MSLEFDVLKGKKLLLASASPRRRELLGKLDVAVSQAHLKQVDENYPTDMPAEDVPAYISQKKAAAYAGEICDDEILVAADTVVVCDGQVLGKPADAADAERMLRKLSGRRHLVVTGVTLMSPHSQLTFSEKTEVEFAELSDNEITHYVEKYSPLDKAGAYGIQDWIGYIGVCSISGDYYNVMGLPLHSLYMHLKRLVEVWM